MSKRIESFRDLNVYQLAFKLQQEIFNVSKSFPAEERYSLTDQMRRSSRSIGSNIAEAWQKRRYQAHFISKISFIRRLSSAVCHLIHYEYSC